jgi:hypothetical protein
VVHVIAWCGPHEKRAETAHKYAVTRPEMKKKITQSVARRMA